MSQFCEKMVETNLKRRVHRGCLILRSCIRCFWDKILMCSLGGMPIRYRMIPNAMASSPSPTPSTVKSGLPSEHSISMCHHQHMDSDLVALKISLLGDSNIGKTSFLKKYVGSDKENGSIQWDGLNLMDKTFFVEGVRISYSIWDVSGEEKKSKDHIPMACKDTIAIFYMFDLTSRRTLKSVLKWYKHARKYNQTATSILIGTKFDEFIQLPIEMQWTIASQARSYAKAMNATLFFSSSTYNINVNKVFKFITAKLFDIPWTLERNLKIGEPIIDF